MAERTGRSSRLTRENWVEVGMRLMDAGRMPADVTLPELCAAAGMTKGSFYSHFPDGIGGFHRALLDRWTDSLRLDELARDVDAVQNPGDQLRLLAERMASARSVPAMQRWAATSPHAASAVARAAGVYSRLAIRALTGLGLAETAGQLGGALLIRAALSGSPLASDVREEVQAFIDLAERAARSPAG